MDTSGPGRRSDTRRAGGLAALVALAAIGCDAPRGARVVDDAGITTEMLRVEAHLPPAFRDPPARFAARPTAEGWRFARPGLDATFGSGGLRLRAGALDSRVELLEVARGTARVELGEPRVVVDGARVRVLRGAHVEELFVHGEPGIEHVVSLERVPGGGGPLELVIGIAGGTAIEVGARGARVIDSGRNVALVYEGVRAWDARGVELAAWMEADPRGVRLVIDDAGASPPIVVDPLIAVPRTVLSASDRASGDWLGHSVDLEGDIAVAGAPDRAGGGAAYVFERTASGWVERATLVPPGAMDGDDAGWSVAISGDTIVVGSPGDNHPAFTAAGAVDVFRRVAAGWAHEARIAQPLDQVTTSNERFGYSVAIAGDLMVVGAIGDRTSGFSGSGAAYVYRRTGSTWAAEGALSWARASSNDSFGASVATDGTRIAVGAPYENGLLLDGDGFILNEDVGAIFVFERSAGAWVEQARLAAATERSYEYLGESLALDGHRLLAGALGADDDEGFIRRRGAAYVFAWSGTAWTQEARLVPESSSDWPQLGVFGSSVALQGSVATVGAPGALVYGAAFAFQRGASTWSQVARVVGTGNTRELGSGIGIEGSTWIAGAQGESFAGGTDQGALHVYELAETGAQGQACLAPGDCASGLCVDGVCCDVACAGGPGDCQACSVAAGAAVDGECGPVTAGTICRAPVAACDAAEACDGVATTCPADARAPAGTVCRAAAGPCDAEETCSGTAITCPFDDVLADGEACDDGMMCNGADACTSGVCGPSGGALACDDGDACTADSCAEPSGCAHPPIEGCCTSDAACDDGDACTTDACVASSCTHEAIAGCGETDAGRADAGAADAGTADAGDADAGTGEPPSDGGWGCAAPGRTTGSPVRALLGLLIVALVARGRRRCRS